MRVNMAALLTHSLNFVTIIVVIINQNGKCTF